MDSKTDRQKARYRDIEKRTDLYIYKKNNVLHKTYKLA